MRLETYLVSYSYFCLNDGCKKESDWTFKAEGRGQHVQAAKAFLKRFPKAKVITVICL